MLQSLYTQVCTVITRG